MIHNFNETSKMAIPKKYLKKKSKNFIKIKKELFQTLTLKKIQAFIRKTK